MQQKQRNKTAWVLIVVLVPLLIYLVVTNTTKVRKAPTPQAPPAIGAPGAGIVPPGVGVQPPRRPPPPADPKVFAEQKRIAALLPRSNPFNPARTISADQSPATVASTPPVAIPPPAAADTGIKLMAIVARGGSRMAMINGCFLGEGDRIAGWTIIKVNNRDVLLKNGNRQMVLRLK